VCQPLLRKLRSVSLRSDQVSHEPLAGSDRIRGWHPSKVRDCCWKDTRV
jgi:hypothetical protein